MLLLFFFLDGGSRFQSWRIIAINSMGVFLVMSFSEKRVKSSVSTSDTIMIYFSEVWNFLFSLIKLLTLRKNFWAWDLIWGPFLLLTISSTSFQFFPYFIKPKSGKFYRLKNFGVLLGAIVRLEYHLEQIKNLITFYLKLLNNYKHNCYSLFYPFLIYNELI